MSERFIKLMDSDKTNWLQKHFPNAFLLLSYLSRNARTYKDGMDGLEFGEVLCGEKETPSECGLTTRTYRTALEKLIEFGFIELIYNPAWKNSEKHKNCINFILWQKRLIKMLIKSKVVKIINSEVYDIRFINTVDLNVDQPLTNRGSTVDKQRLFNKPETEREQQQTSAVAVFFDCLKEDNRLNDENRASIMKHNFSEERISKAIEYSKNVEIKSTITATIIWHCQQSNIIACPKKKYSEEEKIKINSSKALELKKESKDSPTGIFSLSPKYCEIIPIGSQCEPTVLEYTRDPEEFISELQAVLRRYGMRLTS